MATVVAGGALADVVATVGVLVVATQAAVLTRDALTRVPYSEIRVDINATAERYQLI